ERVVLAGGIVVNTGTIETPHGQIVVTASPGGRYVEITPAGSALSFRLPVAEDQALAADNLRPLRLDDIARLATGTVEVGGTLTTASNVVNPNSRIELVGEDVKLVRGVNISTAGTTGLIQVQVNPLVPVDSWVFVDRVSNYEDIVNALAAGNRLVLLNPTDAGVDVVNRALVGQVGIKALHIVGSGNDAQIWFGQNFIDPERLDEYATRLAQWGQYLDKNGGIFFYTCNLAQSAVGKALVDDIARITGRAVSASTDITGSARYNGNWLLEYGTAGNRLPFVVERIADADVKLFDYTVTNASDVGPPTNSLRFALNKANANVDPANNAVTPPHTIKFFFSAATTINLAAGPLPVNNAGAANKQVTITNVGNGEVTIIAQANNQVFEVFPNNTLIIDGGTQGIILQGNGTVGDGGVILVKGEGSLTLTGRVTVKDGQAKNGGGIALLDGTAANKTTLTITGDVQIINNKANVVGGTKFGGGIYAAGANTLITIGGNALIGDGTPGGANLANKGGGIYTKGTLVVGGDAKIDLNKANVGPDNLGGGIFAAPGATVTLQNNAKVINNEAATPGKGGGVFLDSDPVANQFSILTVKDNALVKTNTAVVGGGIFVNSGSLVILQDKAQVSDNRADKDGGGIFAAAGAFLAGPNIPIPTTVKLIGQDVQVTGNKSGVTVVDRGGGGIYLDSTSADKFSTLLVDKAQITGNKALNNGDGGGIYVTKFSQVTLQNGAKVNSNKADNRGGGIFSLADLTIPATVQVNNNQATNQGGGIFIGPDKTLVVEGQINGNEATATIPGSDGGGIFLGLASKLTLKGNAQVNNNSAASRGGGIFAQKDNTVTIEGNAQVNSNTSAQGAGIAVFADSVGSTLTVDANAQVNENTATDKGGGIFAEGSGAGKITKVFLKGSAEVSGNRAASTSDTSGGGIFAGQDTLVTIEGSAKVNNNVAATTGVLKTAKGGGIFADGTAAAKAKLVVQASAQIKGNSATTDGGGIFAGTNSILEVQGNALIDGNRALTGAGGGILTQGPLTVKDGVVISNNVAKTLGGGIAATKTLTLLNNVQVVANKVVGDNGIGGGIAGAGDTTLDNEVKVTGNKVIGVKGTGGGIATQGNLLVQGKVIVSGNLVDGDDGKGGGIAVAGPTAQIKGEVVISSNQVTGKNALGGGIAVAPGSTLTIDGSVVKITGNVVTSPDSESPSAGGGIAAGGPATLKNKVEVTGNKALGPNAVGGGIAAADALTLQNDVLVAGNQATAQGGGIFTTTALTAQDNVLIGKDGDVGAPNTSKQGGGVFVAGGTATLKGSVKVSANTATTQGGGLFANDLTTVNLLDNVKVAANTANQQGGGLFARGGSAVLLDNNAQIIQNQANQQGSGVFVTDNGTSLTLQGSSKVIQNKTTLKGGGIFAQNGSFVTLDKSSQVAENLASQQGAGLFATGAGTVVTTKGSALVTKNVVNQEGGGFFVTENAKLTVTETAQVTENKATKGGGIFSSTDSVVELSGKAQVTNNKADRK
ncbi:MAG: DUF4347 domain-containing protein, partial [Gloeomargarita sp. SKYB31]|nr:DUF4347 domain-containing protein [Gloeomargarita sp. SKYB31]